MMFAARLIAVVWLLGAIYILVASRLSPGMFGTITAGLAIPAGIGILLRRKWAVVPAVLLCLAWGAVAILLMVEGAAGLTVNNVDYESRLRSSGLSRGESSYAAAQRRALLRLKLSFPVLPIGRLCRLAIVGAGCASNDYSRVIPV